MAFYAVSTQTGKEPDVADGLGTTDTPHIHAVIAPSSLNAYIIVEADGRPPVEQAVSETPYATKVLDGKTSPQEALSLVSPGSTVPDVGAGDIVEVTDGPYKGKQARVQNINSAEETVTVELHEEPIPIPISVNGDQIRAVD